MLILIIMPTITTTIISVITTIFNSKRLKKKKKTTTTTTTTNKYIEQRTGTNFLLQEKRIRSNFRTKRRVRLSKNNNLSEQL